MTEQERKLLIQISLMVLKMLRDRRDAMSQIAADEDVSEMEDTLTAAGVEVPDEEDVL